MQVILYIFDDAFYDNFETVFWNLLLLHTFYSEIESSNCVFLYLPHSTMQIISGNLG